MNKLKMTTASCMTVEGKKSRIDVIVPFRITTVQKFLTLLFPNDTDERWSSCFKNVQQ